MIFDFVKGFNDLESPLNGERPMVAISANMIDENSALHNAYSQAIVDAGAVPIIVPTPCDESSIISLIRRVDGVLLSGGADIGHMSRLPTYKRRSWRHDLPRPPLDVP